MGNILNFKCFAATSMLAISGLAVADTQSNAQFSVTYTVPGQGLFGDPVLLSNGVLRWRPTQFFADSDIAASQSSTALITIVAKAGFDLSSLSFSETGVYITGGYDVGPVYSVSAAGSITSTPLNPASPSVGGSFSTGSLTAPSFDYVNNPNFSHPPIVWATSAPTLNFAPGLKKLSFLVTDTLLANANDSAYSWISKTTAELSVGTAAVAIVPEPETWAMLLAGLGAVAFMSRRRSNG
jgi:hypothetical protein